MMAVQTLRGGKGLEILRSTFSLLYIASLSIELGLANVFTKSRLSFLLAQSHKFAFAFGLLPIV
jgi:hypothetical protein